MADEAPSPSPTELLKASAGPPALAGSKSKLHRAGEHLKALKGEARAFREERSYSIGSYTHPDTGNYFLYVIPKAVPPILSTIAGDVLGNLRPALDYLVFALAKLDSGEAQEGTQFPICDSPELFAEKKASWLKGLSAEHVAAIERLQPYPGRKGKIWLAWLRDLSNPDKHRELNLMASDIGGDFEILKKPKRVVRRKGAQPPKSKRRGRPAPSSVARLSKKLAQDTKAQTDEGVSLSIPPDHKLGRADVHVQLGLRFDIAFENGLPVVEALELLHSETAEVIKTFEPEFKGS